MEIVSDPCDCRMAPRSANSLVHGARIPELHLKDPSNSLLLGSCIYKG
jgi:hypothetical protein